MGMCKIINDGGGKIRVVHQLNPDGSAYAEDITIEVQPGVPESRLAWLAEKDGEIGTFSWAWRKDDIANPDAIKFPGDG